MMIELFLLAGAGDFAGTAFLVDADPKGYALGIAGYGYSEGAVSNFYNPAGLGFGLKTMQHEIVLNGMQFNFGLKGGEASLALPLPMGLTVGGRIFGYLTEVETYDSQGISSGSIKVGSYIVEVSVSKALPLMEVTKDFYAGARVKLNMDKLAGTSVFNGALDAGVMYLKDLGEDKLSVGAVLNNLGYSSAGTITYASLAGGVVYLKKIKDIEVKAGIGLGYEVEPRTGVGFQIDKTFQMGSPKRTGSQVMVTAGASYEYFPSLAFLGYGAGLRAMVGVRYSSGDSAYELVLGARPMADFASYYALSLRYIASL